MLKTVVSSGMAAETTLEPKAMHSVEIAELAVIVLCRVAVLVGVNMMQVCHKEKRTEGSGPGKEKKRKVRLATSSSWSSFAGSPVHRRET